MSKVFDLPSRKVFIEDLKRCVRGVNSEEAESAVRKKSKEWSLEILGNSLTLRVVWIQGSVIECSMDGDIVTIDDGTARAKLMGCNKIPYLNTRLEKDDYAMVIGQIVAAGDCPVLRPIKIQT
ncbi:hypothetical protein ScPMuIL_001609 [Solemya velum]